MSDKLIAALKKLDTTNDDHWTQDGLPRLEVLKSETGENVTRADIFKVAKSFNRFNPVIAEDEDKVEGKVEDKVEGEVKEAEGNDTVEGDGTGETLPEADATEKVRDPVEPTNVVKESKEELSDFEAAAAQAEKELEEARLAKFEAENAFKVAQEKADKYRKIRAKEHEALPPHLAVKAYQKSQQEQRSNEAGKIQLLRQIAESMSPEEAAALKGSLGKSL